MSTDLHAFHLRSRELVAAFAHLPPTPDGRGVLLVPPFGWDDQASYRPRRTWAQELASAGHVALRVDLPSTGDSAGSFDDADRLGAWTDAVADAVAWLRGPGGATRVAVVAMGLGGLITLRAIASGCRVEDAVLWGTPAKGRRVVRELRAFARLELSQTGEEQPDDSSDEIRAGGHVMSAETTAAVHALDADALLDAGAPERAFVLGRDGVGPDEALVSGLRRVGVHVEENKGRGWGAALGAVDSSRPPWDIIAATEAFLAAAPAAARGKPPEPPPAETVEIAVGGTSVRETPLLWPSPTGRSFGVLAEPVDGPARGTAMLLNSGAIRHIGPNRMWTETARRWAARGVATLRFDLESIGDSDGDGTETPYIDAEAFHTEALQQQVQATIDMLVARGLPDRLLVSGVCSGAYMAFHAALESERVHTVVSINQRSFFWDPDAQSTKELRRFLRIFTPQGFRNMLIGERRVLRLWRLVKWLVLLPVRRVARHGAPRPATDQLDRALELLRVRDQRLHLAFSSDEPLFDELAGRGRLPDLQRRGVQLHELPLISHTLRPMRAQRAASELLDQALAATFSGAAERQQTDEALDIRAPSAETVT